MTRITSYNVCYTKLLRPAPKTMNINLGPNDFEEHRFLFVEIPKFIFYYLTAPVFWVVTYLKLKEKEV